MTVAEELKSFALFRNVEVNDLEALGNLMKAQTLTPGETLFSKNDPGDAMFLIRRGRVRIFMRDDNGTEITFRNYGAGQLVGEFALIDEKPRSASAAAGEEEAEVLVLQRESFLFYLREHPMLGVEMMRSLAERVRYTTQYLEKLGKAVSALSNSDYEQALREMAISAGSENEIQTLIQTFLGMVKSVQDREVLRKKVAAPSRIELD